MINICFPEFEEIFKGSRIYEETAKQSPYFYIINSFYGIGEALTIELLGELGDITRFDNHKQLIALIENNYQEDGSIRIPEILRPYMGRKEKIEIK